MQIFVFNKDMEFQTTSKEFFGLTAQGQREKGEDVVHDKVKVVLFFRLIQFFFFLKSKKGKDRVPDKIRIARYTFLQAHSPQEKKEKVFMTK